MFSALLESYFGIFPGVICWNKSATTSQVIKPFLTMAKRSTVPMAVDYSVMNVVRGRKNLMMSGSVSSIL